MAEAPIVTPIAEEVWEALAAWSRADAGSWHLLTYVDALVRSLQDIADVVRDDDEFVGWARLLDVDAAPEWALDWLAQFVGVVPLRGLDAESQRLRIRSAAGFHRGSPAAISAAASQFLTGSRRVELTERDEGSAWRFRIRTYKAETPNPDAVFAAIQALKPAGTVFVHEVQEGLAIDELFGSINGYLDTINSFSNTTPTTGDPRTPGLPFGIGEYGRGPYGYGDRAKVYGVTGLVSAPAIGKGTAALAIASSDWHAFGVKPNLTTAELQAAARSEYDRWMLYTLATDGMPAGMPAGAKRIKVPDQVIHPQTVAGGTVSEGMGYGLSLCAWFGNPTLPTGIYDPNAQANFDALWTYTKHYLNVRGLMNWNINSDGTIADTGGATDGDFDIAMGLLLAHRTWGSGGAVNYGAEATAYINAIGTHEFTPPTYTGVGGPDVMMNGDQWGVDYDNTMPDYFYPGAMREFGKFVGKQAEWDARITKNYRLTTYFHDNFAGALFPDRCRRDGTTAVDHPNIGDWPDTYRATYNSVRAGWRHASDLLWHGPTVAPAVCSNLLTKALDRHRALYGGLASNIQSPPIALDGTGAQPFNDNSSRGLFGPMALMRSTDADYAAAVVQALDADTQNSYFNQGMGAMALAFMSGIARTGS